MLKDLNAKQQSQLFAQYNNIKQQTNMTNSKYVFILFIVPMTVELLLFLSFRTLVDFD